MFERRLVIKTPESRPSRVVLLKVRCLNCTKSCNLVYPCRWLSTSSCRLIVLWSWIAFTCSSVLLRIFLCRPCVESAISGQRMQLSRVCKMRKLTGLSSASTQGLSARPWRLSYPLRNLLSSSPTAPLLVLAERVARGSLHSTRQIYIVSAVDVRLSKS